MKNGLTTSLILHAVIVVLTIVGLPFVNKNANDVLMPVPIEIVDIADITQTNKAPAKAKPKKPVAQKTPKEPVKIEKPEPPKIEQPPVIEPPKPEPEKPKVVEEKPKEKLKEKPPEPKKESAPKTEPPPKKEKPTEDPKKEVKKTDFSSLLKDLTPDEEASESPEPEMIEDIYESEPAPNALLSDKLTISQLDAFIRQIEPCWNVPAGAKMAEDLIVEIRVFMNPDATLRKASILDQRRYNRDSHFRAAADSAMRALRNPRCTPLKLPLDKYELWKTIVISFNPKDLL